MARIYLITVINCAAAFTAGSTPPITIEGPVRSQWITMLLPPANCRDFLPILHDRRMA